MKNLCKKFIIILFSLVLVLSLCSCGNKESKKLYMATEGTFPPYEFYEGDKLVGIDVEIAAKICEKLGCELEIVDTSFKTIVTGVESGKYDFGMAGLTVNEERLEKVNFTDSYSTGVQVVIVKEGSKITSVDDLFADGAYNIVGSQEGTTGNLYASDDIEAAGLGEVKGYEHTTDAIEALKLDKCDCVILDSEPAKALVKANEGLKILDTEYVVEDYAICIAKDNAELLKSFNDALAALKADGTVKSIVDKYIK